MEYRALGSTGLTVSAIGFGGWAIGGQAFGAVDEATALAALNRAYELGCTLFSVSDAYDLAEDRLAQALRGWNRGQVVISGKGGQGSGRAVFSEAHLRESVEASLKRLNIDAFDLYHLQNPSMELIHHGHLFDTLHKLVAEGKIRHTAITIHDPQEGVRAITGHGIEAVEAVYNLFDRRAEKALPECCAENGAGLIIREPLARGFLSGTLSEDVQFSADDVRAVWPRPLISKRIQAARQYADLLPQGYPNLASLALKFALHQPGVSTVLPDLASTSDVEAAMRVPNLPALSPDTLQALEATGLALR